MRWHDALVRRLLADAVRTRGRRHLRGRLIDIGCGVKPYRAILAGSVIEHVGVDQPATLHGLAQVDVVATAYAVPLPSSTFDSALMTEVLEHLEEPLEALRECHRLLRPGGALLVTAPFIWHLHEAPRDFFRYSIHGLAHLLERAGFEVVEVSTLGGFWSTFGQLLVYNLEPYDRGLLARTGAVRLVGRSILRAAAALERRSPRPAWASHSVAVARKPGAGEAPPGG